MLFFFNDDSLDDKKSNGNLSKKKGKSNGSVSAYKIIKKPENHSDSR